MQRAGVKAVAHVAREAQCGVRCHTPSLYIQTEPCAQQKRLMAGLVLPRFCIM